MSWMEEDRGYGYGNGYGEEEASIIRCKPSLVASMRVTKPDSQPGH